MHHLPAPDSEAAAHSGRVAAHLRALIAAQGGWLSFATFMEQVLYAPGLGYYSAGAMKFGAAGDFVTAPEMSALFGSSLARQVAQGMADTGGDVLELGAGSGRLACDLLLALEQQGQLPEHYLILEISVELKARQLAALQKHALHLLDRVSWLNHIPSSFRGVILGNEVLDALPVHLVLRRAGDFFERGVVVVDQGFAWHDVPLANPALREKAARLDLPDDYLTEINLAAPALIATLADNLEAGLMLFLDYGFSRAEFYHPQRTQGTLMCHYRHHAHGDPFLYPGLQDVTAHVEFSAIAEAGIASGCELLGYTTQAHFLINCGITDLLSEVSPDEVAIYLPLANQVQKLLSPAEMGELFKVICLGKGVESPLLGFTRGDQCHRL